MPCPAYSIPAKYCQTGNALARDNGGGPTVCSLCYASRNRYRFGNVQSALERRYSALMRALSNETVRKRFIDAMVSAIGGAEYFRWHDSGDLQSIDHFRLICAIAERTPSTRHWIPTREKKYVRGETPANLCVRYSLPFIDGAIPPTHRLPLSTVHSSLKTLPSNAYECKKPYNGGTCGDCRACWDSRVSVVSYALH